MSETIYHEKSATVVAWQWNPGMFVPAWVLSRGIGVSVCSDDVLLIDVSPDDGRRIAPGDWIIKGKDREFVVMTNELFRERYESRGFMP